MEPHTLLFERLKSFAEQPALHWRDRPISYQSLLDSCTVWQQTLTQHAITPGQTVAFFGDFSPNTVSLLLALVANGNIAVPLTPKPHPEQAPLLAMAHAEAVVTFDQADHWQLERRAETHAHHPLLQTLRARGEPGAIFFSSGSTGQPKALLHSMARLLQKYERPRRAYRALTFLLLDHLGGINTLLSLLSSGGSAIVGKERSVEAICAAIERHQIQLLPTTPTFLNMLLISAAHQRYDLSSLELITYGTEPMPPATLAALRAALPWVQLKQTYGLTELGVLPTRSEDSASLWLKVGGPGYETRVVAGQLWIRAPSAMLGYLNAPSPFDEEGWYNTGDAVVERDGYLRILGRTSEMVNVGGEKLYPAEVESVILELDNIRDVTVYGKANPIMGQVVVARVTLHQPETPAALTERIRTHCRAHLAPYKVPVIVEITSETLHSERFKKLRPQPQGHV